MIDRFLRELECRTATGLSRSTRWRMEKAKRFPPRHQISPGVTAYRESEVLEWARNPITYFYNSEKIN